MTSMQMQRSPYVRHYTSNRIAGSRFNGLPDAFGNGLDWQNEFRDNLSLCRASSTWSLIRVHKKTGARPDDFNFRDPHAVNVLHRSKLNNDRLSFNSRASHVTRPLTGHMPEEQQSTHWNYSKEIRFRTANYGSAFDSIHADNPIKADSQSPTIGNVAIAANAAAKNSNAFIFNSQTVRNS